MSQIVSSSRRWSNTTKLVVTLTLIAIVAGLAIRFNTYLGPLLLAFILSYLLYPVVMILRRWLGVSWRLTVTLVYLTILIVLLGLLTWGGITLVNQVQGLIKFLQNAIANIPGLLEQVSRWSFEIGTLRVDFSQLDWQALGSQILSVVQPLISQAGGLVGSIAGGAVSTLGWIAFVLIISYFILAETEGVSSRLINVEIPGYGEDLRRMRSELGRIWNAFLRGQMILFVLTILIYTVLLGVLGVRFFLGLAVLAGLARFVPYVGPAVTWTAYGLVGYFQGYTILGLSSLTYVLIILGLAIVLDSAIDYLITPRLMGASLRVHPAGVLVAALIGASLLGIAGVVLAAPVLASAKLFLNYVLRKLSDLDPWENISQNVVTTDTTMGWWRIMAGFWSKIQGWIKNRIGFFWKRLKTQDDLVSQVKGETNEPS